MCFDDPAGEPLITLPEADYRRLIARVGVLEIRERQLCDAINAVDFADNDVIDARLVDALEKHGDPDLWTAVNAFDHALAAAVTLARRPDIAQMDEQRAASPERSDAE